MKNLPNRWTAALAIAAVASASGCSTDIPGNPSTTPSGASSSTSVPEQKAPTVREPLDSAKYVTAPCSSLSPPQREALTIQDPGKQQDINGNPNCLWKLGTNDDTSFGLTFMPNVKNGLSNLYALNDSGQWKSGYFDPTTVGGYPAVYNHVVDHRDQGDCTLSVGIADSLFFTVNVLARAGDEVCVAAKNVATAVIETIKKGA